MNRRNKIITFIAILFIIAGCANSNSLNKEETLEYIDKLIQHQNGENYELPKTFLVESYSEETKILKIGSKETITGYKSNATLIYDAEDKYLAYFGEGEQNGASEGFAYYLYKQDTNFIFATEDNGQKTYEIKPYTIMNGEATISAFLTQLMGDYEITIKGQDLLSLVSNYFDSFDEENNTLDISLDGITSNLYNVNKFEFLKENEGHFKYDVNATYEKEVAANATTKNTYIENMEISNYSMLSYEAMFKSENNNSSSSSISLSHYTEKYTYSGIEKVYPNLDEYTLM